MRTTNLAKMIRATNGRFFTVQFIKKNGEKRHMIARTNVTKHLRGGSLAFNPADYRLMVVWDTVKKDYRMINLATLRYFQCGAKKWRAA